MTGREYGIKMLSYLFCECCSDMELFRRESDYALRCLVALARRGAGELSSARRLGAGEGIPEALLRKTLLKLARARLVVSVRGSRGGFRLISPPDKTTLLEIVEAVQGPVAVNRCFLGMKRCPNQSSCSLSAKLQQTQQGLRSLLRQTTLKDLLVEGQPSTPNGG